MLQEVVSGTELSYNYLTMLLNIAFEGLHEFLDQGWTPKWKKKQQKNKLKNFLFMKILWKKNLQIKLDIWEIFFGRGDKNEKLVNGLKLSLLLWIIFFSKQL